MLAFLSVSTVLLDYSAIVSYSSMQTSQNIQGLEYPIPFFLIFKLALTPIMTHIFSCLILNRYFVKKTFFHFLLALVGILVYEFTVFDNTGASYSEFVTLMGRLKLVLPTIYTFTVQTGYQVIVYKFLPYMLVFVSCVFNGLLPVLSKSYLMKHAHALKLSQYQSQKLKLKEGQLNVQYLDKDMLLKPKLVTMTSQVYKRY